MKNKIGRFLLLAAGLIFLPAFPVRAYAEEEELPPLPPGPLVLTSVTSEQLSPEYWIRKIPDAEKPLMPPEPLQEFNEYIRSIIPDRRDVLGMGTWKAGKAVRDQIELEYNTVKSRKLFGIDDQYISPSFFEEMIRPVLAWEMISDKIRIRWGAAIRPASVRALPAEVKMLEEQRDYEFDQLQFTLIKLWTPVAILHESSDHRWYYIQAPYSRGWVKAKDIAVFPGQAELKRYVQSKDFLVVTGESVPIYFSEDFQAVLQRPSMGTVLPLKAKTETSYQVWLPRRGLDGKVKLEAGYLDLSSGVSVGYLPYSQANMIRQAFKLLGARYGWGGMYHGRDCSGFTHDVFLSLGVDMPRNSKEQAFVGTKLSVFEPFTDEELKIHFLEIAKPGVTLIRMPLHLMLYLGKDKGHYYVIHSTWAERISMTSDEKNRINQVIVSDLTLNGKSYLGSLYQRIVSMNEIAYS